MSKLKIYKRTIKHDSYESYTSYNPEIGTVPKDTNIMEPILVRLLHKTPNPTCLTKVNLNDNNIKFYNNYKCKTDVNDYKKYLYVPPIGIMYDDILKLYDIDSIDSMKQWVDDMIEDGMNYYTINRVINCWIRKNFDLLKNNNFLEKIYYKLLSIYLDSKIIKKIDLEKEIKQFINTWSSKKKPEDFDFNLYEDMYLYLSNK